ncbi:MAG: hypothetical protein ACJ8AW_52705, partial [Rhodopila sp.]
MAIFAATIARWLSFRCRRAAEAWIEENQLGRRNLTPDQFAYFVGRKLDRMKKQGQRTDLTFHQNEGKSEIRPWEPPSRHAADRIAKQHG